MLPPELRVVCERLLGSRVYNKEQEKWEVVSLPVGAVCYFLDALATLENYRSSEKYDYSLLVCTVFGYRRLIWTDLLSIVDEPMLALLRECPEIIPDDCYTDRLPPNLCDRVWFLKESFGRLAAD